MTNTHNKTNINVNVPYIRLIKKILTKLVHHLSLSHFPLYEGTRSISSSAPPPPPDGMFDHHVGLPTVLKLLLPTYSPEWRGNCEAHRELKAPAQEQYTVTPPRA